MSIVTKTGDRGTTAIMYSRRVLKTHPRVETVGAVDELNAALGLARALDHRIDATEPVLSIQKDLVGLMGEIATDLADLPRYQADGFPLITAEKVAWLDRLAYELESRLGPMKGWATPGPPPAAAVLDLARAICRRAERKVWHLHEQGLIQNNEILVYLNRLSDVLWLLARHCARHTDSVTPHPNRA